MLHPNNLVATLVQPCIFDALNRCLSQMHNNCQDHVMDVFMSYALLVEQMHEFLLNEITQRSKILCHYTTCRKEFITKMDICAICALIACTCMPLSPGCDTQSHDRDVVDTIFFNISPCTVLSRNDIYTLRDLVVQQFDYNFSAFRAPFKCRREWLLGLHVNSHGNHQSSSSHELASKI